MVEQEQEQEQERHVSLPWQRINSAQEDGQLKSTEKLRRRRCIQCCGCFSALILIVGLVLLILIFTVFRVKSVTVTLNSVTVEGLKISNPPSEFPGFNLTQPFPELTAPSINMTMISEVSIKNPNIASFKFNNATTTLYYDGSEIGEVLNPAGNAKARKTLHMNLTVEVYVKPASSSTESIQHLRDDIESGYLTIESYTWIDGRVNALNIFKRYIIVKMNCTMIVVISTQSIENLNCHQQIKGL